MGQKQNIDRTLSRGVVNLSLSRLVQATGNGFVIIVIPTSVAALPHDLFPFGESVRVGLTVSLFGLVLSVFQPVLGKIASRRRADRLFLLSGIAGFCLSTAAMAAATSYWQLLLLRAVQGLSMALVVPSTLSLVAYYAVPSHRGAAMGFYGMARMVGFGLGPLLGGAVLLTASSSTSYLFAAVPSVFAFLLVTVGVPRRSRGLSADPQRRLAARRIAPPERPDPGLRPFLALGFGMFAAACSLSLPAVLENEFMRRLDQSTLEFGIVFSSLVVIRIFVDWPVGRLSDRVGRKRLMVPGLACLGPVTVLMAYAPNTIALTGVGLTVGVAMAFVSAPTFALASDLAPAELIAEKVAWVTAGFSMGLAVGPLIAGALAHNVGFHAPFWLFGGLSILASVVAQLSVSDRHRRPR